MRGVIAKRLRRMVPNYTSKSPQYTAVPFQRRELVQPTAGNPNIKFRWVTRITTLHTQGSVEHRYRSLKAAYKLAPSLFHEGWRTGALPGVRT